MLVLFVVLIMALEIVRPIVSAAREVHAELFVHLNIQDDPSGSCGSSSAFVVRPQGAFIKTGRYTMLGPLRGGIVQSYLRSAQLS